MRYEFSGVLITAELKGCVQHHTKSPIRKLWGNGTYCTAARVSIEPLHSCLQLITSRVLLNRL